MKFLGLFWDLWDYLEIFWIFFLEFLGFLLDILDLWDFFVIFWIFSWISQKVVRDFWVIFPSSLFPFTAFLALF